MASAVESLCHKDPNFAVICNFWDRYGEMIGLKETSYADLERWLEDTKQGKQWITVLTHKICRLHAFIVKIAFFHFGKHSVVQVPVLKTNISQADNCIYHLIYCNGIISRQKKEIVLSFIIEMCMFIEPFEVDNYKCYPCSTFPGVCLYFFQRRS